MWKTFTGNIVKLVGGKQDSKKDDPAPSVGDLGGLPTLSPDSLTTAQQPETSAQQPEVRGWVKDSQGKWIWLSGQESVQQPNWKPNWKPNKWVTLHDYGPWDPFHESAYYDLYHDSAGEYDSAWMYDYEG